MCGTYIGGFLKPERAIRGGGGYSVSVGVDCSTISICVCVCVCATFPTFRHF